MLLSLSVFSSSARRVDSSSFNRDVLFARKAVTTCAILEPFEARLTVVKGLVLDIGSLSSPGTEFLERKLV